MSMMLLIAAAVSAGGPGASAVDSLDAAVRRYDQAQVHGDARALDQLLAGDYLLVNSGGEVEDRKQFIADLTDPGYRLAPYAVGHAIERRWRDGAIMGGVALLKGVANAKPFSVCLRFVDVWRRDHGRWQVAYSQAMHAKPGDCAAG